MMNNFKYCVCKPCLDYYEFKNIEIFSNQFDFLIIERRYDNSWWLIGCNYKSSKFNETQIEEISNNDVANLIMWCNNNNIHINARSLVLSDIDIIKSCYDVYKIYLEKFKNSLH